MNFSGKQSTEVRCFSECLAFIFGFLFGIASIASMHCMHDHNNGHFESRLIVVKEARAVSSEREPT